MSKFNVGLEICNGLLATIWESSLRVVRRNAITILMGGDDETAFVARQLINKVSHLTVAQIYVHTTASYSWSFRRPVERHYLSISVASFLRALLIDPLRDIYFFLTTNVAFIQNFSKLILLSELWANISKLCYTKQQKDFVQTLSK